MLSFAKEDNNANCIWIIDFLGIFEIFWILIYLVRNGFKFRMNVAVQVARDDQSQVNVCEADSVKVNVFPFEPDFDVRTETDFFEVRSSLFGVDDAGSDDAVLVFEQDGDVSFDGFIEDRHRLFDQFFRRFWSDPG